MTGAVFNPGDPVAWTYWHHMSRTSKTRITKTGVFVRVVQHDTDYVLPDVLAVVKFKGNKTNSRVPLKELRAYKGEE